MSALEHRRGASLAAAATAAAVSRLPRVNVSAAFFCDHIERGESSLRKSQCRSRSGPERCEKGARAQHERADRRRRRRARGPRGRSLARGHPAAQRGARGPPRAARQVPQRAALASAQPRPAGAAARSRRHCLVFLQEGASQGARGRARRRPQAVLAGSATRTQAARARHAPAGGAATRARLQRVARLPYVGVTHTALALFDHVNLVYGTVSEFCTAASCPDMTGPGGRSYAWYDERGKKSRVAAPQYVDYVMTYTQKTVNDETVFPTKYANEFPTQFESVVRRVVRLLFHVVAHMYAAHFRELALLRLHAHLHLTFAHLTALDRRFSLLDHKETEVLRDLEVALRLSEPAGGEAEEASPRRRSPVVTQPLATA